MCRVLLALAFAVMLAAPAAASIPKMHTERLVRQTAVAPVDQWMPCQYFNDSNPNSCE